MEFIMIHLGMSFTRCMGYNHFDQSVRKIQNLTDHLRRFTDNDTNRLDVAIQNLNAVTTLLQTEVRFSLQNVLEEGKKKLRDRDLKKSLLCTERVISQGSELLQEDDKMKDLISEACHYKGIALIAQEKEGIEWVKKAVEINPENKDAQSLLKTLQDPEPFRGSILKTLIYSRFNPNVTYY